MGFGRGPGQESKSLYVCAGKLEQLAEGVRITAGFWATGSPSAGIRLWTVPSGARRRSKCASYHGLLWKAQTAHDHD